MDKFERNQIAELRGVTKKSGMNRYRFAWWLIHKHPNLVVAIIRQYLSETEKQEAADEHR